MPCPSFYKLVLPSTLQDNKLWLPDDFVKKYGGSISSIVTLTVPDGTLWSVGLRKEDKKVWFLDGWNEFLQYYSIETGYFLIFRYQGKSCFVVNIYSFATSEINYKSPAQSTNKVPHLAKHLEIFEDLDDEVSNEVMQVSPTNLTDSSLQNKAVSESADKFTPGKSHSPPALQNMFNGSRLNNIKSGEAGNTPSRSAKSPDNQMTRDIGLPFNVAEFKKSIAEVKLHTTTDEKVKKPKTKKRKSDVQEPLSEHEVEMQKGFYKSASARKRTVTAEEREKAMNEAKSFESSNPFCRVVLRPSYLYKGCIMYLPSCFAENLNGISDSIKLQISDGGKQWSVRCLYKDGKAKLSQGWFDFAFENSLREGDVCIFELVAAEVLHVTFFRVTEEEALLQNRLVEG